MTGDLRDFVSLGFGDCGDFASAGAGFAARAALGSGFAAGFAAGFATAAGFGLSFVDSKGPSFLESAGSSTICVDEPQPICERYTV